MAVIHNLEKFRNKLIVFEGEDHVAKSTIAKGLQKLLNEEYCIHTIFTFQPGGYWGNLSNQFRSYCKDKKYNFDDLSVYFLFLVDRSEQITKLILPELKDGRTVISDRWAWSSYAYQFQGNELLTKYKMNRSFALWMNDLASHYVKPDYSILISREQSGIKKVVNEVNDNFESKDDEFKLRVHNAYEEMVMYGELTKVEIIENDIDGTLQKVIDMIELM